ncbi:hypothetical protein FACS1894126_5720 [Alphaproteobacteria bacterium]|nr:hypothetical protein FACS1894126_5720 [Alphaproteobacteria bacterium]
MGLIRKSEWARRQGCSKSYVSKMIKGGKLYTCNGMIDEEKANSYKELQDQLLEARLKNEQIKGEILEAKVAEIERKYVSADAVKKVMKARNRIACDAFLQIPDRISALIAPLKDAAQIHTLLTNEIRNTLFALSNDTNL